MIQADGFTELDTRYKSGQTKAISSTCRIPASGPPRRTSCRSCSRVRSSIRSSCISAPSRSSKLPAPALQWLAKSLFVGVGERYPNEVVIRFFKVE